MAKLRLTVLMEVAGDSDPGSSIRMAYGLAAIARELRRGNRAGEVVETIRYSQGGELNRDDATYDWQVDRI